MNHIKIKVSFQVFSKIKELCNQSIINIEIEPLQTLEDCFYLFTIQYPQITKEMLMKCKVAQNNKYLSSLTFPIVEDSQYLLISPISGG